MSIVFLLLSCYFTWICFRGNLNMSLIAQVTRRQFIKPFTRAYSATPVVAFGRQGPIRKQQQEDQVSNENSTVYVAQEVAPAEDATFSPIINHVFDE
ncbi:unnamed protein product [Rhizopus microsporus]